MADDEKKLACIEQTSLDLKTLLKVLRSSTSFDELTPTLVNSLIRRIEVHNNDKSSGHCYVKVDIYFTAIGLIDIPTEDEIKSLMAKIKADPQEIQAYRLKKRKRCNPDCGVTPYPCQKTSLWGFG